MEQRANGRALIAIGSVLMIALSTIWIAAILAYGTGKAMEILIGKAPAHDFQLLGFLLVTIASILPFIILLSSIASFRRKADIYRPVLPLTLGIVISVVVVALALTAKQLAVLILLVPPLCLIVGGILNFQQQTTGGWLVSQPKTAEGVIILIRDKDAGPPEPK